MLVALFVFGRATASVSAPIDIENLMTLQHSDALLLHRRRALDKQ